MDQKARQDDGGEGVEEEVKNPFDRDEAQGSEFVFYRVENKGSGSDAGGDTPTDDMDENVTVDEETGIPDGVNVQIQDQRADPHGSRE